MLTIREKYLIKEAYLQGFDRGWYMGLVAPTPRDREFFYGDSRVYELCKNWLNEEVAECGIVVEMVLSQEAEDRVVSKLKETREWAQELYEIAKAKGDKGDFAYELAALSFESHLADLSQIERKKANER
jgi:hypothetical protein